MKKLINKISKTNLLNASLLACVFGALSNTIFNATGCAFFNAADVSCANNLIDTLQLSSYIASRLIIAKRLNRFDLPFILGGLTSLSM